MWTTSSWPGSAALGIPRRQLCTLPEMSDMDSALDQFDRTEINLDKLAEVWRRYEPGIPDSVHFGTDTPEVDQARRDWTGFVRAMPAIDGFRIVEVLPSYDDIAQNHWDANEVGEVDALVEATNWPIQPGRELAHYRHQLRSLRRALVRSTLDKTLAAVDSLLSSAEETQAGFGFSSTTENGWAVLEHEFQQLQRLLGPDRPSEGRWADMARHLRFAEPHDLRDIVVLDWPTIRQAVLDHVFDGEPVPVQVSDLAVLVASQPSGPVSSTLNWKMLDADGFERLVLAVLQDAPDYENAARLMHLNASDKGRDLSADRVVAGSLSGVERVPVMVQCKHYPSGSANLDDCRKSVEQAKLWPDAGFRVVVVATSGNFSQQAVEWVEHHRSVGGFPAVELWPQSHLELVLAGRPHIRSSFGLIAGR